MKRILLVGMTPSPRSKPPHNPLSGSVGKRLARLCQCSYQEYLTLFERRNLCPDRPWRPTVAWDNAQTMQTEDWFSDVVMVVMLGRGVQRAFGYSGPFFKWYLESARVRGTAAQRAWSCAPHPSGRSRYWNEPANHERAGEYWKALKIGAANMAFIDGIRRLK